MRKQSEDQESARHQRIFRNNKKAIATLKLLSGEYPKTKKKKGYTFGAQ